MTVTYRITMDDAYCRTVIRRYYQQRPFYLRPNAQFAIVAIPIVIGWVYLRNPPDLVLLWVDIAFLIVIAHLVAMPALTRYLLFRRLRNSVDFGREAIVTLSDEGLMAASSDTQSKTAWPAFSKSVRYRDGIMLLRAGVIRWLPDSALQGSIPQQATDLVQSKTKLRYVA